MRGGGTRRRRRCEKSVRVRIACCWHMGGGARQEGGEDCFNIYGHDARHAEPAELRRCKDVRTRSVVLHSEPRAAMPSECCTHCAARQRASVKTSQMGTPPWTGKTRRRQSVLPMTSLSCEKEFLLCAWAGWPYCRCSIFVAKTANLAILASHFRPRVDTPTKVPLGSCLNQRDGATHSGGGFRFTTIVLRRDKIRVVGVWGCYWAEH